VIGDVRARGSAARHPAQKPQAALARRWPVCVRVAYPITMAFPARVALESVVILRIVKAALAIFIDPGVSGRARNLGGQGKAHHENDDPRHVWPICFASCHIQKTARGTASSIRFRHFLMRADPYA
jgi:hypothetical protein